MKYAPKTGIHRMYKTKMAENKGVEVVDGIRFFLLFYVLFSAVFSALFGRAPKGSGYPLQVRAPR